MQTRLRPALGERASRTSKLKYCNERSKPTTTRLHWSRLPSQRQADAELLADFCLEFQKVPGTTFFRLCGKGDHYHRDSSRLRYPAGIKARGERI